MKYTLGQLDACAGEPVTAPRPALSNIVVSWALALALAPLALAWCAGDGVRGAWRRSVRT